MFNHFLETATEPGNGSSLYLMLGIVAVFIALMVYNRYSQKKSRRQAEEMNAKLVVGSKVKTIGGLVGDIAEIDDENGTFTIQSGTSTFVIDRQAVYSFELFGAGASGAAADETFDEPMDDEAVAAEAETQAEEEAEQSAREVEPEPEPGEGEVGH